jgi:hypothetical protein
VAELLPRIDRFSLIGSGAEDSFKPGGSAMKEVLPGVLHWTRLHPKIKLEVSSYYLVEERVLIDATIPEQGVEAFPTRPEHVLLTNRHHYRDSEKLRETFQCTVRCVDKGMHEFGEGQAVEPFAFGDILAGGIQALEVDVLCPDETALLIPRGEGILAVADGLVRMGDGPLGFVPDAYMGDDPESVKAGLKQAYGRLLDRQFDHLLLAHGLPWIGGGKQALRQFV